MRPASVGASGVSVESVVLPDLAGSCLYFTPSTWWVQAGRSEDEGCPQLCSGFEASLGYLRISLKGETNRKSWAVSNRVAWFAMAKNPAHRIHTAS